MRRVLIWFLVSSLAACSTTRNSAGPFVTDIRVDGAKLVVDRCEMDYTREDHTGAHVVYFIIVFPLLVMAALGGGGGGGGNAGLGPAITGKVSRANCVSGFEELPHAFALQPGGV